MPFCLSSTGPKAICRVPFSLIVLEVPIGEVTWLLLSLIYGDEVDELSENFIRSPGWQHVLL